MHNAHDTKATLVLGSTGKSGRRVTAWRMQRRVLVQGRFLLRRAALRLGGPCHMGSGTARCGRRLRDLPAGCGGAGRGQNRRSCAALAVQTGTEAGTAVRPGEEEGSARRCGAGVRRRLDNPACPLVCSELQRELPAR